MRIEYDLPQLIVKLEKKDINSLSHDHLAHMPIGGREEIGAKPTEKISVYRLQGTTGVTANYLYMNGSSYLDITLPQNFTLEDILAMDGKIIPLKVKGSRPNYSSVRIDIAK